jgi:putative transposase
VEVRGPSAAPRRRPVSVVLRRLQRGRRWRADCFTAIVGRIPRRLLVEQNSTNHCTWRGHDFGFVLGTDAAKRFFLDLLAQHKDEYGIEINSYTVMNSHPHVQCRSTLGQQAFSEFWRMVNYRFARWYNRTTGHRGQVVMQRMTSARVETGRHQLEVMRYGDLNPVRGGISRSPKDWPWSSYRYYAFGEPNPLVTPSPEYLALGDTPARRRLAYVHLFAAMLSDELRTRRRDLVVGPFFGTPRWIAERSRMAGFPPPD